MTKTMRPAIAIEPQAVLSGSSRTKLIARFAATAAMNAKITMIGAMVLKCRFAVASSNSVGGPA